MTEKEKQLLIKCGNSMVNYLTPEELDAYSDAEQTGQEMQKACASMLQAVKERNISGWEDAVNEEEEKILRQLSPELREASRVMYPEELMKFAELHERQGRAIVVQANLMELAAGRAEAQERGTGDQMELF